MSTTGEKKPRVAATVDRAGATAWTNANNALSASDSLAASAAVPTDYLVLTDFGFSIPASATIRGVTLKVTAYESGSGNSNYIPQLISDATPTLIGTAKTAVTVTGTAPVTTTDGSATDLWSATANLTPSAINSTGFGVAIWSTDTVNTLFIDHAVLNIDYIEKILPTGKASDNAFGTPTLRATRVVTPTGKASDSAFGSFSLNSRRIITPTGKATDEAFGTVSLSSVAATAKLFYVVYPSALGAPSDAQVKSGLDVNGDPAVASGNELAPASTTTYTFAADATGLSPGTSYRIAFVWNKGAQYSNVAVSDPWSTLTVAQTIEVVAKASDEAFGTVTLQARRIITPNGKATDEAFGSPTLRARNVIQPNGKATDEAFGTQTLRATRVITPNAKASDEVFGTPTLRARRIIEVNGKATDEAFGTPTLTRNRTIQPNGKATDEAFGAWNIFLQGAAVTIYPNGKATDEAFGSPTIVSGSRTISPNAKDTDQAFGTPAVLVGKRLIYPNGKASDEAFGAFTLFAGPTRILPNGKATDEAFGTFSFIYAVDQTITFTGQEWLEFGNFILSGSAVERAKHFWDWMWQRPGVTGSINERMYQYLTAQGFSGSVNEMVYLWLISLGYTGSTNEMINQFERDYTTRWH